MCKLLLNNSKSVLLYILLLGIVCVFNSIYKLPFKSQTFRCFYANVHLYVFALEIHNGFFTFFPHINEILVLS